MNHFLLKFFWLWPSGSPSSWFLWPFNMPPSIFEHFLPSWFQVFQVHLVFLALALNQLFLLGAMVPFIGKWRLETKVWVLCVLIATRMSLFLGPHSRWSWKIYVCIAIHTGILTFLYLFLPLSFYILSVYFNILIIVLLYRVYFSLSPLLICNFFFWQWETMYLLMCSVLVYPLNSFRISKLFLCEKHIY